MIIANGRLRFPAPGAGGGGIDAATGHALAAPRAWDAGVACQCAARQLNYLGEARGERRAESRWVVYLDAPCAPRRGLCRLEGRDGRVLAERELSAWEELEAVGLVRVVV